MKRFTFLLAVGCLLGSISCSHTEEPLPPAITYTIPEDGSLEKILLDFDRELNGPATRSMSDLTILRVEETDYVRSDDEIMEVSELTRSSMNSEDHFTIIKVDFDLGERKCSALLKQRGENKILYYYSDNGYLIEGIEIPALNRTLYMVNGLDDITDMDRPGIGNPDPPIQTGTLEKNYIVSFQWGQDYPYNISFPTYTLNEEEKHYLVGCGAVAVGQAMATYRKYKSDLYPNSSLSLNNNNFIYLPKYTAQFTSENQKKQVSEFLYDVAKGIGSVFNPNGTDTGVIDVCDYLIEQDYDARITSNFQESLLQECLNKRFPFVVFGENTNGDHHCWLIDGIKTLGDTKYYHCNWGWNGNNNCWVKSSVYTYDPEKLPPFNLWTYYIYIR